MSEKKGVKHTVPERPKTCIGELCFDPAVGKLVFSFDRVNCPRDVMTKLDDQTPMIIRQKAPKQEEKP